MQKRVCNVCIFRLNFYFAYHHCWLGVSAVCGNHLNVFFQTFPLPSSHSLFTQSSAFISCLLCTYPRIRGKIPILHITIIRRLRSPSHCLSYLFVKKRRRRRRTSACATLSIKRTKKKKERKTWKHLVSISLSSSWMFIKLFMVRIKI